MGAISKILSSDDGVSSKRVLAIAGFLTAAALAWFDRQESLEAFLLFSCACLGITGAEKFKRGKDGS